jgi:hypothetical protein
MCSAATPVPVVSSSEESRNIPNAATAVPAIGKNL